MTNDLVLAEIEVERLRRKAGALVFIARETWRLNHLAASGFNPPGSREAMRLLDLYRRHITSKGLR
jgi:NADPH-dependent glutamate synthase beta subunit-like oxidoreductase